MNDLISRQDAINVAYENMICDDDEITCEVIGHIARDISLLPSVDRPSGKWIDREYCQVNEDSYEVAICSECGAEITIEYSYDSYCPNCGAKMI